MGPPPREPLLQRIVEALEADPRVAAAWLMGSIGRGEDDAWSDLDLHVAIHDEHLTDFWSDRFALYERVGQPVLIQDEKPSNAQPGGHFQLVIFDGPLEVDWNVGPLSVATRSRWHVVLLARADIALSGPRILSLVERRRVCQERLTFAWAMAPIAIKYVARGQTRRAVGMIGLVTDAYIALWRLVEMGYSTPGGLNQPLEPDLDALLPRLDSAIDSQTCLAVIRQLCDRLVELHPHLAEVGVVIPHEMPAQLARLAAELPG
jgi:predicted nucleotidyltransferase